MGLVKETEDEITISMSEPHGQEWDGVSAKRCQQKSSFITCNVARRLPVYATEGDKIKLKLKLNGAWGDHRTYVTTFTVVSDDTMNVDVALGENWKNNDSDDIEDVSIQNQSVLGRIISPWVITRLNALFD